MSNLNISKNCQTCPFLFVGTCGDCIQMQEEKEKEERVPLLKEENKYMIPKTYDYEEGN